jgi:hypothetical protein
LPHSCHRQYGLNPKDGKEKAVQFLTEFCTSMGQSTFAEWKALYRYLFVKYMDGNIKTRVPGQLNPSVKQPGYSEEWKRMVARGRGQTKGSAGRTEFAPASIAFCRRMVRSPTGTMALSQKHRNGPDKFSCLHLADHSPDDIPPPSHWLRGNPSGRHQSAGSPPDRAWNTRCGRGRLEDLTDRRGRIEGIREVPVE